VEIMYQRDGETRQVSARLGRQQGAERLMEFFGGPGDGRINIPGLRLRRFDGSSSQGPFPHDGDSSAFWFGDNEDFGDLHDMHIELQGLEGLKSLGGLHGLQAFTNLDGLEHEGGVLDGLHEWLGDLDLDGGATSLRIRIEDGEMTIERDGEVETYRLDELHGKAPELLGGPRKRLHEDEPADHDV
jgi:hypothetical protein